MRIAVFSDIHGNQYAYEAFIEAIEPEALDQIWFLGDWIGYYYGGCDILRDMRARGVRMIRGNHDQYLLDALESGQDRLAALAARYGQSYEIASTELSDADIDFLRCVPAEIVEVTDGCRIRAVHGAPWDLLEGRAYPDVDRTKFAPWAADYDFLFLGHTHHQMELDYGGLTVINPGSLGQQRDGNRCSYLIFDTIARRFDRFSVVFDTAQLIRDVKKWDPHQTGFIEVLTRKPL
ncbi:MAG: metallophosphoesterase family protein [Pseudomonadota bacterium]